MGVLDKPELAKQLTFGEYNDLTPSFSKDGRWIYYISDEMGAYNINAIDLEEKAEYRYTDVKTGNFFPIEIPNSEKQEVVMSSWYKGQFHLFRKDLTKALQKRQIEFSDLDLEMLAKKREEVPEDIEIEYKGNYKPLKRLFVQSLPPVTLSIGTDGSFFGYSYLTLTDLLGDHNFTFMAASYYGYRSYHLFYLNQKNRLQLFTHLYASQDAYYYTGYVNSYYRTVRQSYGGEVGIYYPFSREYRAEAGVSLYNQQEDYDKMVLGYELPYGQFFNGWAVPLRVSLVGDNIGFENYGPNRGHTFKITLEKYFKIGSDWMDAFVLEADLRKYIKLDRQTLLAFRFLGTTSSGKNAPFFWTGGNNTIRSIRYSGLTGTNMFWLNAELRFPLIQVAATPIGLIGPVRGVFFFDVGGAWYKDQKFRIFKEGEGLRLEDPIASYGFGLEFFVFGYPMHVDWVWRTDLKQRDYYGVNFWIGFDF